MLVGYARVSTRDQSPELQLKALMDAGCDRVFTEAASGAQRDRPELTAALDYLRPGDTLVVWKLDRLARSVHQLVETAAVLQAREIGLKVLTQQIDTTTPGGRLVFHMFAAIAEFETGVDPRAHPRRPGGGESGRATRREEARAGAGRSETRASDAHPTQPSPSRRWPNSWVCRSPPSTATYRADAAPSQRTLGTGEMGGFLPSSTPTANAQRAKARVRVGHKSLFVPRSWSDLCSASRRRDL